MLLLVPLLVAMLLALPRGGSLRYLAAFPVRGSGFLLGSFALQLLLYAPGVRDSGLVLHDAGAIYIGTLGLVLIGALRNWHLGGAVRVAVTGLALNVVVTALNSGHMLVDATAMAVAQGQAKVQEIAGQHVYSHTGLSTSSSRLAPLADVIPVRLGSFGGKVYSLGDMLLASGSAVATYGAVRRPFNGRALEQWLEESRTA